MRERKVGKVYIESEDHVETNGIAQEKANRQP